MLKFKEKQVKDILPQKNKLWRASKFAKFTILILPLPINSSRFASHRSEIGSICHISSQNNRDKINYFTDKIISRISRISLWKSISGALRDLAPFAQFKKREKHPWRSVTFRKVACFYPATLIKGTHLHGCFSRFLNCTNDTKLRNVSHIRKQGDCFLPGRSNFWKYKNINYFAGANSKITSFKVKLSILSGSESFVEISNKFGHCIIYSLTCDAEVGLTQSTQYQATQTSISPIKPSRESETMITVSWGRFKGKSWRKCKQHHTQDCFTIANKKHLNIVMLLSKVRNSNI